MIGSLRNDIPSLNKLKIVGESIHFFTTVDFCNDLSDVLSRYS